MRVANRPEASVPVPAVRRGKLLEVAPDLAFEKILFANVIYSGEPGSAFGWVLVDTGPFDHAERIVRSSTERFGRDAWPKAIVLTHGHFDHVGAVRRLAEGWDVPVYAHEMELPFLTGRSSYPPGDPTVGGGAMAWMSPLYPTAPIDLGPRIRPLPADGSIPEMPGWRWIHTPGHSPGHVSLFRDSDRTLIAGDAFVTTDQESALAVALQTPVIHGPPKYFTIDWEAARRSVEALAALRPATALTGHGPPVSGDDLRRGLDLLASRFEEIAVPRRGRYVHSPARADAGGIVSLPPPVPRFDRKAIAIGAFAAAAGLAALLASRRRSRVLPR